MIMFNKSQLAWPAPAEGRDDIAIAEESAAAIHDDAAGPVFASVYPAKCDGWINFLIRQSWRSLPTRSSNGQLKRIPICYAGGSDQVQDCDLIPTNQK